METLTPALLLTALSVVVALLGVIVLMITIYEYTRLRGLEARFEDFERRWQRDLQQTQKALQRVVASYQMTDPDARIRLLEQAVGIDPLVFNGYNALGYAYQEKGDRASAADAFREAIHQHPEQVEGFCDLARLYQEQGETAQALKYLRKARRIDAEAVREGVRGDNALEPLLDEA